MPEPELNREDFLEQKNKENSFFTDLSEHINDLRKTLLIIVSVLLITTSILFNFSGELIKLLEAAAPVGSSFFQLKPGELLSTSLKVSLYGGGFLSLPIILWQVGCFINPALKDSEKKIIYSVFALSPILFWLGLFFAYYLLLPPLLDFLLNFKQNIVEPRYGLEFYINLVLAIITISGISFQIPIVIATLGFTGIVKSKQLTSIWRYAVLFAFVSAAFITPTPDPMTMSLLALALLLLYFVTILVLKLAGK